MAFGLYPSYNRVHPLSGLTRQQSLVLAIEAAARLGWRFQYLSNTGFFAVAGSSRLSQITIRLTAGRIELVSSSLSQELSDGGRNKQNISSLTDELHAVQSQIPAEQLEARYAELSPMLPPPEADAFLLPPAKVSSAGADLLAIFRPVPGYFITPIILNLNLLVFLLMGLSGTGWMEPHSPGLIAWGANVRSLTLAGEWWRLLTCCFVHIGAIHLLLNMYAFLLIGAQLEPRLGRTRFLFAYLLSGIVASTVSLWWHDGNSISAGASGAIFGMYGVFLVMLRTELVEKAKRKQLLASMIFFIGYNLLGGLQAGVDNAAHIGGLMAGVVISLCFIPGLRREQAARLSQSEAAPDLMSYPATATPADYHPDAAAGGDISYGSTGDETRSYHPEVYYEEDSTRPS